MIYLIHISFCFLFSFLISFLFLFYLYIYLFLSLSHSQFGIRPSPLMPTSTLARSPSSRRVLYVQHLLVFCSVASKVWGRIEFEFFFWASGYYLKWTFGKIVSMPTNVCPSCMYERVLSFPVTVLIDVVN